MQRLVHERSLWSACREVRSFRILRVRKLFTRHEDLAVDTEPPSAVSKICTKSLFAGSGACFVALSTTSVTPFIMALRCSSVSTPAGTWRPTKGAPKLAAGTGAARRSIHQRVRRRRQSPSSGHSYRRKDYSTFSKINVLTTSLPSKALLNGAVFTTSLLPSNEK
jgi:hypothetical protein